MSPMTSTERSRRYREKHRADGTYSDPTLSTRKARQRAKKRAEKYFIALDGEGDDAETRDQKQNYILLGASTGERLIGKDLQTLSIFKWLDGLRAEYGNQFFIMYGMGYDVEMWLRQLSFEMLGELMDTGRVYIGRDWKIEYFPNKIFILTNLVEKRKITIFDMRGWWSAAPAVKVTSSEGKTAVIGGFIAALDRELGLCYPGRQLIIDGKLDRGTFTYDEIDDVDTYMSAELERLVDLGDSLRAKLLSQGWDLSSWHGSGALANYLLKEKGIKQWHPVDGDPPELWQAALGSYYGGWIDLGYIGVTDRPVYQIDINSAYPWAMTFLPPMEGGFWREWDGHSEVRDHAMYYVKWWPRPQYMFGQGPHPFSFRRKDGGVIRPPLGNGWVHGIEIQTAQRSDRYFIEIQRGLEFIPKDSDARQFDWVAELYDRRNELKRLGDPAEQVLKTAYATLYGKEAQRTGRGTYQNMFHAGEITARTRALMWEVAISKPGAWVSSMTDSLYSFEPLDAADMGNELGQWKDEGTLSETVWCQAGVMFGKAEGGQWGKTRVRGFGSKLLREDVLAHMANLCDETRPTSTFQTFVGMRQARAWNDWTKWRRWYSLERKLDLREPQGKRYHPRIMCRACDAGLPMDQSLHDMFATTADSPAISYIPERPDDRDKWIEEPDMTDED